MLKMVKTFILFMF